MLPPTAGVFPFLHGVYPEMYRRRPWTMRQYAGFGTATESNQRYRYLLAQGVTGLSIAFDLPTQLGLDADDPRAAGEVGRSGVSISTLADMETLFDQIPLDQVSTSMTINATAAILLAMYLVVAEQRGVSPVALSGTVQNDVLKEFAARGNFIYPPAPSMRLTTDVIAYSATHLPKWNPISISGYHMREAGCTAVQEVAFTLANGLAYVQAAVDRGLEINAIGPRLSFFFNAHNNFLEEIAKFRAARSLWAALLRTRFHADDAACRLRFHTQTAGSTLTAQQVGNNIVRVAYQAMAAVFGGTQSLHTNSQDEALALPTEIAARTALRTQQILAHETGVTEWVDPLAGSYVVEALTEKIQQDARVYLERIQQLGGAIAAIESGFIQHEIHLAAYAHQQAVEDKSKLVVGVNTLTTEETVPVPILKIDPQIEVAQRERLRQWRTARDTATTNAALEQLKAGALGTDNVVPLIVASVRARATLGEISHVLRSVWGEYQEPASL
ncbi:MAG: methylmalonyl-CoA mutase [Deltaproteobacteria bacterium]|nr:methylmalonyl-CoA mutase [Deltaproteobacteria bacterium]